MTVTTERRTRREGVSRRLARIEGQVRGVSKMIEDDRYCIDVLTQVKAIQAAMRKVEAELLSDHADHCLAAAIASDDQAEREKKVAELVALLMKKS